MEIALWKRALAEFFGVFLLASIGLMVVATAITTQAYDLFGVSIVFALVIMTIIMVVGAVSGAQINPAITIALAVFRKFPWREVPVYVVSQISGGVVGALVLYFLYRGPITAFEKANDIVRGQPGSEMTALIFSCFAPHPAFAAALKWSPSVVGTGTALLAEAFATMVLAVVVFAVTDERNAFAPSLPVFALTLGLVVGFIVAVEAPLTMAGLNPARDLGPRIAISLLGWAGVAWSHAGFNWWVWTVGPIIGAVAGGAVWTFLFGSFLAARPVDPLAAETEAEELHSPTPGGNPPSSARTARD
ncbi:MAG TPA: aquaporin [Rubrobacteraceae bacterium]|nr:aquaporin [Rubrobacteraceae bacterium]